MKKLTLLIANLLLCLPLVHSARLSYNSLFIPEFDCDWHCEFEYPNKKNWSYGEDIYVKVKPQKYQDISYINLYCGNKFIRKESSHPYEWCHPSGNGDSYLRNLPSGNHRLRAQIVDKCGGKHDIYYDITVSGGGNNHACHYNNPLNDLHWLKQIRQQHSDWAFCEYKKGGKPYFKAYKCGVSHYTEYWYNCSGEIVCQFQNGSSCSSVQGAQMVKCWYDPCGNNHNDHHDCDWEFWFDSPQNNHNYHQGSHVYVKVNAQKHQDIQSMDLYVNNNFVRKETSAPYEWCKPNTNGDTKLKNLKKGTYHLKVRVKDRCGEYHEKQCSFTVN